MSRLMIYSICAGRLICLMSLYAPVKNSETGGACIPWMAFRMLRILTGMRCRARLGKAGRFTVTGLYEPNGQ